MPPFFVQLRFPMEDRWVTVAVDDSRPVASAYAGTVAVSTLEGWAALTVTA